MPTVNIPDKICPHCGGTRWCVFQKKDWRTFKLYNTVKYYTDYSCANISETGCLTLKRKKYNPPKPRVKVSKEHTSARVKKYREKNKHKWISQSKQVHAERLRHYYKINPNYRLRINEHSKKSSKLLTDAYIKKLISCRLDNVFAKDIPQDLVEVKRKQLLLTRSLKNLG